MKFYVLVVLSTLLAYANSQTVKSAAEIATERAQPKSTGQCGTYVRTAIQQSQGKPVVGTGVNAKDFGPWLENNGYSATSKSYTEAEPGDVAVLQDSPGHPYGHTAIYNGNNWVSDFSQKGFYPYKDGSKPSFTIYSPNSSGQGSTGSGSSAEGNDAGSNGIDNDTYDSTYGSDYDGSDYASYASAADDSTSYGGSNDGDDDLSDEADSVSNDPVESDFSEGDGADADADEDGGDYGGGYGGY